MNNTRSNEIIDTIFISFGYIGGGLLAICIFPQIIKLIKTKSSKNLSIVFQIISLLGLLFFCHMVFILTN